MPVDSAPWQKGAWQKDWVEIWPSAMLGGECWGETRSKWSRNLLWKILSIIRHVKL